MKPLLYFNIESWTNPLYMGVDDHYNNLEKSSIHNKYFAGVVGVVSRSHSPACMVRYRMSSLHRFTRNTEYHAYSVYVFGGRTIMAPCRGTLIPFTSALWKPMLFIQNSPIYRKLVRYLIWHGTITMTEVNNMAFQSHFHE